MAALVPSATTESVREVVKHMDHAKEVLLQQQLQALDENAGGISQVGTVMAKMRRKIAKVRLAWGHIQQ